MISAVSAVRIIAFALGVALTLTPAVVGACAALLCAPAASGTVAAAGPDHDGHHPAPASGRSDAHAHHASMQGSAGASATQSGAVHTGAAPLQLRGVAEHDCCAGAGAPAIAAVPGTNRLDDIAAYDAAVRAASIGVGVGSPLLQPSPPIPSKAPSSPASSPRVLRI
jgi:hypothetical protein